MSVVAAGIIGGAVIGAGATVYAAGEASDATTDAAQSSAAVTLQTTQMQLDELSRQFDYQQQILAPFVEQQQRGGQAYTNVLAYRQGELPEGMLSRADEEAQRAQTREQLEQAIADARQRIPDERAQKQQEISAIKQQIAALPPADPNDPQGDTARQELQARLREIRDAPTASEQLIAQHGQAITNLSQAPYQEDRWRATEQGRQYGARDEAGAFYDPNLRQTSLQEQQQLPEQVARTRLAPTDLARDVLRTDVESRQLAGPSLESDVAYENVLSRRLAPTSAAESERMGFAQDRNIYGREFQESPGYAFAVEEMNRQLDRKNSAGGNYGGRALMEAQRRAQGLASQDYYQWASGAERDRALEERVYDEQYSRETQDASRLDAALLNYLNRQGIDTQRLDSATLNYLSRRAGDVSRMDAAVGESDRLAGVDLARSDQQYYNYLGNLGAPAGFTNAAGQAVGSSQQYGTQVSNVYGNQGTTLANLYTQQGYNQANIAAGTAANLSNIAQGGIENYISAKEAGFF